MQQRVFGVIGLATLVALGISACGGGDSIVDDGESVYVPPDLTISAAECTAAKAGTRIDTALIGEPVSAVTLDTFTWVQAADATPAHCRVEGTMQPMDPSASVIEFAVVLPQTWNHRAGQQGGGGNNGSIPNLSAQLQRGWAGYGSDSGHQGANSTWALADEAVQNFGYMQLKKTHDAAWVVIERVYGSKPVYSYFFGNSQGGREALTAAQRYPEDYDGIVATVPVVGLSNIQLSRALQRIQERSLDNWVPQKKTAAIATEFIRQCDKLDGLVDGVINNYNACRDTFDARKNPSAWNDKRCPGGLVDPNPEDTSANACFTDGQIATLQFTYTPYQFATPLAWGTTEFGMYVPNITPDADGALTNTRFAGQEGATPGAASFSWSGGALLIPALWDDSNADPLTYVEGGVLNERRLVVSQWLDSTNPDLSAFYKKGGKLIVDVGMGDTRASNGAQLHYYEALHQTLGKEALDKFARLYVHPQGDHGLFVKSYTVDGDGNSIPAKDIPSTFDHKAALVRWVETNEAPGMNEEVTGDNGSLPLCSYPMYPHFKGGALPTGVSSSYECRN